MSNNNNEESLVEPLSNFLGGLDHHNSKEKLFLLAGLIELLRHTKSATDLFGIMALLEAVQYVDWARIPFSVTKTLLSDKYHQTVKKAGVPDEMVPDVLWNSLLLFIDKMWANTPAKPTESELQEIVEAVAASTAEVLKPEPPAQNPKLPAATPDVFNTRMVRRVFEAAKFTTDLAERLRLVVVNYRGVLPSPLPPDKRLGHLVRGVAFQNDEHYKVLLETGEYLDVPVAYEHITVSTAAEDFKNLNPALLLALTAAREVFEAYAVIDAEQSELLQSGSLGKFLKPHFLGVADADDLRPMEHVFDIGREASTMGVTGATSPVGAVVRFPVPATDMSVLLEAQQDSMGPYCTARLVRTTKDGKDTVLMRHETPRVYSPRGVYLFPLQDSLVSLTAIF